MEIEEKTPYIPKFMASTPTAAEAKFAKKAESMIDKNYDQQCDYEDIENLASSGNYLESSGTHTTNEIP